MRERRAARDLDPAARVGAVKKPPPFTPPEGPGDFDDLFAEPPPTERVDPKTYKRPKKTHRREGGVGGSAEAQGLCGAGMAERQHEKDCDRGSQARHA